MISSAGLFGLAVGIWRYIDCFEEKFGTKSLGPVMVASVGRGFAFFLVILGIQGWP